MADSGCSPEVTDYTEDNSLPGAGRLVNGHLDETQLHRKLSLLCPDPMTASKHLPLYLGDEDHPSRALIRDAISPSPRQDERRRAEELHNDRLLFFRPRVNRMAYDQCPLIPGQILFNSDHCSVDQR